MHTLGLVVAVAIAFAVPAVAAEHAALSRTIEWSGNADGDPRSEETASDQASNDVWQRIRNGFKISDDASANPLVAVHEAWYAARPAYVRRMAERSRRYLFHIVQEVDRRAMPMEIALLPMVESAFNPVALSSSDASGIWQFIPSTGRHYGLKQDTWYDGRRDFTAATNAALDYLGKLYLDFGDWQLALAAYNCGEGCVGRAIQKNVELGLPTDYASLSLPEETRHYVPKLLALKNLIRQPEQFGLAIDVLPNQPYFNQVTIHANMDIHSAARLADMSSNDFIALNAAFPRNLIRSDTPVNLLLPVDKTDKFQRNLETSSWDSWQPYEAKKGERLAAIAQRFNVTIARLEEHNQFKLKRGKLVREQSILVPIKGRGVTSAAKPPMAANASAYQHRVETGETLFGIARRYGLSVTQLVQANPGLNANVRAGQTLELPLGGTSATTVPPAAIRHVAFSPLAHKPARPSGYTVKRGDTLLGIAQRFDVSLADLKKWNPVFRTRSTIRPGQEIVVGKP
ncbi:MAG: LysM peptidoglycan-binding domain-containing protein [Thiobacillus sp.]|nr:LysM peptidoglycan-binding domain-containing protein [Thiobacillus sp.]